MVGRLGIFPASLRIWPAGMTLLFLKITSSGNAESRTPNSQEIQQDEGIIRSVFFTVVVFFLYPFVLCSYGSDASRLVVSA